MTSASPPPPPGRRVALVTGAGRTAGIGAGIARQLAAARELAHLGVTANVVNPRRQLTERHP